MTQAVPQVHRAVARHIGDRDSFWLRGYRLPPDVVAHTAQTTVLVRLWRYDAQNVSILVTTHPGAAAVDPSNPRDFGGAGDPTGTWELRVHPSAVPERAPERVARLYLAGGADLVSAFAAAARDRRRLLGEVLTAFEAAAGAVPPAGPGAP